jgi:hypothetical protein
MTSRSTVCSTAWAVSRAAASSPFQVALDEFQEPVAEFVPGKVRNTAWASSVETVFAVAVSTSGLHALQASMIQRWAMAAPAWGGGCRQPGRVGRYMSAKRAAFNFSS